jgi:hypothetical protein
VACRNRGRGGKDTSAKKSPRHTSRRAHLRAKPKHNVLRFTSGICCHKVCLGDCNGLISPLGVHTSHSGGDSQHTQCLPQQLNDPKTCAPNGHAAIDCTHYAAAMYGRSVGHNTGQLFSRKWGEKASATAIITIQVHPRPPQVHLLSARLHHLQQQWLSVWGGSLEIPPLVLPPPPVPPVGCRGSASVALASHSPLGPVRSAPPAVQTRQGRKWRREERRKREGMRGGRQRRVSPHVRLSS